MRDIVKQLTREPAVRRLLDSWEARRDDLVQQALAIQTVPAPTFEEAARAAYVQGCFSDLGLSDVHTDDLHNVYARTPGLDSSRPAVMVSAHLDTVFPAGTDLSTRSEPKHNRIYGPGLGDNSLGLAAMLSLAGALATAHIPLPGDIWWVATVGEEGLGNLRGMRQAHQELHGRVGVAIILEGVGVSRVYNAGLGVRRLRISVSGPGGHSWLHHERPNAIHQLVRIGAALVERLDLPEDPLTTFNIGLIEGGRSINTRAPQASLSVDLRSTSAAALDAAEGRLMSLVSQCATEPDLRIQTEIIGDRPSATLSDQHPLVLAAQSALKVVGFDHVEPEMGSTDANILLAEGVPSVCIGITSGGNAHSADEFIELTAIPLGMVQLTLLTLAALHSAPEWSIWR